MICPNCGTNVQDGAPSCPNCGTPFQIQQAFQQAGALIGDITPSSVLVKGILAVVFSSIVIPGIILGALARKNAKKFYEYGNPQSGQVKTGSILGMVGIILSIVMVLYWLIFIIGMIAGISQAIN